VCGAGGVMPTRELAAPRRGESREHVVEVQRARLLTGAVIAISELGYRSATVAHITARARVSRRTFYELFPNREACLEAVFDDAAETVRAELAAAGVQGFPWRERVRVGLCTILAFLDREPVLAQVCVVQALRADQRLLTRRQELLASLSAVVDEGRGEGARSPDCSRLTAEGLVGAAFAIVHARLLRDDSEPLVSLTSELMGIIVLPYLGPGAARREQRRPLPSPTRRTASSRRRDPLDGVSIRVTYRTMRVLQAVAQLDGDGPGPSNRQIADLAGIHDPGQISKLLRRLERVGLLANTGAHLPGDPNAWALTDRGQQVTRDICRHTTTTSRKAA
jgi:AcrR family transcriptional regulator